MTSSRQIVEDWVGDPAAEQAHAQVAGEQRSYEEQLDIEVSREYRRLKIHRLAQARLDAEAAGTRQPFDAGLLGEVLARDPAPPPRIEGVIPADASTLFVAMRKTGKTTGLLNVAGCLISGREFLDRFPVRPIDGNVAFLNFEVSGHQIATWANDHRIPHDRLLLVNLRGRRNPFADPADRGRLAQLLRSHDVESLIVDPFGRAYTGTSQNDPGEVGSWLIELDQFARQDGAGCTDVILAAHAGWNGERSRGSTALEDWADSIITITRDADDDRKRFIRAEGRDVQLDEDQLLFESDSRTLSLAGTGSRKTTAKVRQIEALMTPVNEMLRASSTAMSGNQLDTALKKLIKDGDLDAKHSKGDGARAAGLLEKRGLVASKDGPRGARLFFHLAATSPTSPDLPEGTPGDLPTSLYREVAQGSEPTHLPNEGQPT